jgi:hypothetical protein
MRILGGGPVAIYLTRVKCVYRRGDLDNWVASRAAANIVDAGARGLAIVPVNKGVPASEWYGRRLRAEGKAVKPNSSMKTQAVPR